MCKIKHILSVIHYTICGAVCFQFTHFPGDDWDNIYIICLIIIIKSEIWTITHCLGLGHETMVCAVCLPIFLQYCVNGSRIQGRSLTFRGEFMLIRKWAMKGTKRASSIHLAFEKTTTIEYFLSTLHGMHWNIIIVTDLNKKCTIFLPYIRKGVAFIKIFELAYLSGLSMKFEFVCEELSFGVCIIWGRCWSLLQK